MLNILDSTKDSAREFVVSAGSPWLNGEIDSHRLRDMLGSSTRCRYAHVPKGLLETVLKGRKHHVCYWPKAAPNFTQILMI